MVNWILIKPTAAPTICVSISTDVYRLGTDASGACFGCIPCVVRDVKETPMALCSCKLYKAGKNYS